MSCFATLAHAAVAKSRRKIMAGGEKIGQTDLMTYNVEPQHQPTFARKLAWLSGRASVQAFAVACLVHVPIAARATGVISVQDGAAEPRQTEPGPSAGGREDRNGRAPPSRRGAPARPSEAPPAESDDDADGPGCPVNDRPLELLV